MIFTGYSFKIKIHNMPLDQYFLEQNELWMQSQQNCIKQSEESTAYSLKEIELHKECIEINNRFIAHYKKGIEDQKKVIAEYIKENS
jgi:hypothetical protein